MQKKGETSPKEELLTLKKLNYLEKKRSSYSDKLMNILTLMMSEQKDVEDIGIKIHREAFKVSMKKDVFYMLKCKRHSASMMPKVTEVWYELVKLSGNGEIEKLKNFPSVKGYYRLKKVIDINAWPIYFEIRIVPDNIAVALVL